MRATGNLARFSRYITEADQRDKFFAQCNAGFVALLWRDAASRGVMKLGGEMLFARDHMVRGVHLANAEYCQTALRHWRHALAIAEENLAGKGRDAGFEFPNDPVYIDDPGEPMGDARDNTEERFNAAWRALTPDKHETAIRLLEQLAAGEVTMTAPEQARSAAGPHANLPADALPGEDPAHFAWRADQADAHAGTLCELAPGSTSVGARLLRELSPAQLAAVIETSTLAQLIRRFEKRLAELELPSDGFKTKEQADAAARLGTTLRDLQKLQMALKLPATETRDEVLQGEAMAATYRRHHDKETGEVIPARHVGRPRRQTAHQASSSPP